jgi:hypothetical protein
VEEKPKPAFSLTMAYEEFSNRHVAMVERPGREPVIFGHVSAVVCDTDDRRERWANLMIALFKESLADRGVSAVELAELTQTIDPDQR